jgi:hypothetical protein
MPCLLVVSGDGARKRKTKLGSFQALELGQPLAAQRQRIRRLAWSRAGKAPCPSQQPRPLIWESVALKI